MADKLDPDKNVTGGTGITAGRDVALSNISGQVVVGNNNKITIIENATQRPAAEASKKVVYQAEFQGQSLIITMPDCTQNTNPVDLDEIQKLEEICRDYKWNQSPELSRDIGKRLFAILNGDRQTLIRALREADDIGEKLQMILKGGVDLPFELLYYNDFLVPSKVHLLRRVSERGIKRTLTPEDRPLKVLLMACSPQDVSPVLEFEKEEDTILEVTKDLPIEIDVEDTGSLEGLGEQLAASKYDIVHITGHADIRDGVPFFLMENEEGMREDVVPSKLWEKLDLNMPRLVFLSGCKTGQAPEHAAAMSYAHYLAAGRVPAVLGCGVSQSRILVHVLLLSSYTMNSAGERTYLNRCAELEKSFLISIKWIGLSSAYSLMARLLMLL